MHDGSDHIERMATKRIPSSLGRTVRKLREARGWSQQQLMDLSGVRSIAVLESGRNQGLRDSGILKLSQVFGVTMEALTGGGGVVSPVLADFIRTKAPRDITEAEIEYLARLPLAGRVPTAETYSLALLMLRSTQEPPARVGND